MIETIQRTLSAYFPISEQTAEALSHTAEVVEFAENDFLEKEAQRITSEFIVLNGIVRGFIYNSKGDDITVNFYTDGSPVTPTILRGHHNSIYNFQVISEKANILVFNNMKMENEMPKYKDLEMFGNTVLMVDSMKRVEREITLLKETAIGKLEWFRKNFPNLENHIQHYYIASFLGITPTSLSRIRANTLKK